VDESDHTGDAGRQHGGNKPKVLPSPSGLRFVGRNYLAKAKEKYRVGHQYGWTALTAIGRWLGASLRWIDVHNGLFTAAATVAIAVLTVYVVHFTSEQGKITNRQLSVMEADQRPWIKTEITFASDLTYSDIRMSVTLHYSLKNVGRSPALNVEGFPKLRPTLLWPVNSSYIDLLDPMKEIKTYCDDLTSSLTAITRSQPWGAIIYPGETIEKDEPVSIEISDIKKILPTVVPFVVGKPEPSAPILMLSCIDYQASIESRHHQTADFSILSSRISADKDSFSDIDPRDRKTVAKEFLTLREAVIYGSKYAN
jgi:hypothetical protein